MLLCIFVGYSHQTVLYMTLRVVKDGLTLDILKGDLDRAAPTYAMVGNSNASGGDTVPLALGPSGSHDFDADDNGIPEDELDHDQNDIELREMRNE